MAKKTTRKLKKGEEKLLENASPQFLEQLKEIKKLPDDCFTYLPDAETVQVNLNGEFVNALRLGLEYLMENEESFRVIRALYRIKDNFKDIPPNKITRYETCVWAVMTLLNTINVAGVTQKKSRVADKTEWFKAFDEAMQLDKRDDATGVDPLDETELANRMGLRVDEKTGGLVIDAEYLKKHDMKSVDTSHSAEDELQGRFGIKLEEGEVIDEKIINPTDYVIPIRKQKGMKGKMEKF